MKKIKIWMLITLTSCASISGCGSSFLSSRDTNPVIHDYSVTSISPLLTTDIFATTASRRTVLVTPVTNRNGVKQIVTCAEPSPDVGEAVSSTIAAALKASSSVAQNSGNPASADAAAQFGRAAATQIAPLLYRTQGLQLYRDTLYKLCIDRMNNWITPEEYNAAKAENLNIALDLIKAELPIMEKTVSSFYTNAKAGNSEIKIDDAIKIIDATKITPTSGALPK